MRGTISFREREESRAHGGWTLKNKNKSFMRDRRGGTKPMEEKKLASKVGTRKEGFSSTKRQLTLSLEKERERRNKLAFLLFLVEKIPSALFTSLSLPDLWIFSHIPSDHRDIPTVFWNAIHLPYRGQIFFLLPKCKKGFDN